MGFNNNYFKQANNIFNLKLKPNQLTILSYLIRMANEAENCYPSMNNIAEMCCVSKSTVVRTIEELEEAGFISVNIDNTYNIYVINYDSIERTNNRPEKVKRERKKKTSTEEKNLIDSNGDIPLDGQIHFKEAIEATENLENEKVEIVEERLKEATRADMIRIESALAYASSKGAKDLFSYAKRTIEKNYDKYGSSPTIKTRIKPRSFYNFKPREYNFDKLEAMLLGYEEYTEEDIHEVLSNSRVGKYPSNNEGRLNEIEIDENVAV